MKLALVSIALAGMAGCYVRPAPAPGPGPAPAAVPPSTATTPAGDGTRPARPVQPGQQVPTAGQASGTGTAGAATTHNRPQLLTDLSRRWYEAMRRGDLDAMVAMSAVPFSLDGEAQANAADLKAGYKAVAMRHGSGPAEPMAVTMLSHPGVVDANIRVAYDSVNLLIAEGAAVELLFSREAAPKILGLADKSGS